MEPHACTGLIFLLCLAAGLSSDQNIWSRQSSSVPLNREQDHEHKHWTIVIVEDDPAVIQSASHLFERHPAESTLIRYHQGAVQVLRGDQMYSSMNNDLVLVGHGSRTTTGASQFAGYGPEEIGRLVSTLRTEILSGHIDIISLISCNLGEDQHFILKVLQILHFLRVEATLHVHTTLVSVTSDGVIVTGRDGVWRSHDHSTGVVAQLNSRGDLLTKKTLGCTGSILSNYEGSILYVQTLEWPRHPQMFVPMELRKKYQSIDCLEGLTWSLFFEENEKRRAPDYDPDKDHLIAVWLKEPTVEGNIVMKHISNIQDLLVEIRFNAREEVTSDLYYVMNECIYKVHKMNLSVSLEGKFMRSDSQAEMELFRQTFADEQMEASLQELQQGLKASKFNDFCRQTFQFQQCSYNCERWGRYFMTAVFSASVQNFRIFSLFLMSVIGCEVGRSHGMDSHLCTAFMGEDHPMVTNQPWPEPLKRGFYGCTVDNYELAPQNRQIWLDQVVAKENALYIRSKQVMDAANRNDQTELEIFGRIKVMNKYVFSSYLDFFRGTPEGKKLNRGCSPSLHQNEKV